MPWFEVLIRNTDVADLDEAVLMNRLGVAILGSDVPIDKVQILQGRTYSMDRIFYVEIPGGHVPQAIAEVLQAFSSESCDAPQADYLTRIQVP